MSGLGDPRMATLATVCGTCADCNAVPGSRGAGRRPKPRRGTTGRPPRCPAVRLDMGPSQRAASRPCGRGGSRSRPAGREATALRPMSSRTPLPSPLQLATPLSCAHKTSCARNPGCSRLCAADDCVRLVERVGPSASASPSGRRACQRLARDPAGIRVFDASGDVTPEA